MKPGWKTTEFWQTVIAQVLGFLAFAGVISTNDSKTLEEALGKSAAAVFTLIVNGILVVSYIRTRFHLKALNSEAPRKLTVLALLAALGIFSLSAPAQAQMLPWRQSITQQLKQHEAMINNLKSAPAPQNTAPQIIVMPPASRPYKLFRFKERRNNRFQFKGNRNRVSRSRVLPSSCCRFRDSRSNSSPCRECRNLCLSCRRAERRAVRKHTRVSMPFITLIKRGENGKSLLHASRCHAHPSRLQWFGAGSNRPIDQTLQDATQRACNLEVWEIFRAYYVAVTQALADNADWPAPTVAQGTTVPSVISAGLAAAAPALSAALGGGPLGTILQSLIKSIPVAGQKAAIQGPVPNPGAATTKPSVGPAASN